MTTQLATKSDINTSGITAVGDRVIVKPDKIEETASGTIVIPESVREKHMHAQSTGILVDAGPDAWSHRTEETYRILDGELKLVERRRVGYSAPFAVPGSRVAFAKYGGLQVEGEDGETYRILNDEDITAIVSDGVSFTDIKARKAVGDR